jgi:uncharacterized protein (DUF433 family)
VRPLLLSLLLPAVAAAQGKTVSVVITDSLGNRVAFAWVQSRSGTPRAADDSGRVTLDLAPADSIPLSVRRIGYTPFEGNAGRDAAVGAYRVTLTPLPQALERINIIAPRENRLYQNGFYARAEDAWRIATPSRFLSPEALEARPASRTSQLINGISFITIQREGGKPLITGRGRCPVTVLIDGRRQRGMVEEIVTREGEMALHNIARMLPASMEPEERVAAARREFISSRQSIDDLINPGTIAALEAYASANQAPVEFRNEALSPTCALIAIWTGPRQ